MLQRSPLAVTGWLLVAALLAFRLLPGLARPGMFFDGVTHAAIARNMAIGVGDFWHPVFSPADGAGYHEQPPLGFWLESLFFRALGDHFWVEKVYSALTGVLTAALIVAIWRHLVREIESLRGCAWLPVALWVALPGWGWMYGNNMLENTLGLFAAGAVYAILRASDAGRMALLWLAVAAAAIMAAALSKGPVGLFPIAAPLIVHITLRRQSLRRAAIEQGALMALVAGIGWLVFLTPGASSYLDKYLHEQVLDSLAGRREVVASLLGRFDIIWKIAKELVVPTAIAAACIWWARRREESDKALNGIDRRAGWPGLDRRDAPVDAPMSTDSPAGMQGAIACCLLIGVSASLPLVLSPKQSGHYAFPSYAFYAIAIALWCGPAVAGLLTAAGHNSVIRDQRLIRYSSAAICVILAILTLLTAGRPAKDADVYRDVQSLAAVLPPKSVIGLSPELSTDYPLLTNLARWGQIGADRAAETPRFFVTSAATASRAGYTQVQTTTTRYRLLERARMAGGNNKP